MFGARYCYDPSHNQIAKHFGVPAFLTLSNFTLLELLWINSP